jgi:hypothetical protein
MRSKPPPNRNAAPKGGAWFGCFVRCDFVIGASALGLRGALVAACTADQLVERCVVAARHAHKVRKGPT